MVEDSIPPHTPQAARRPPKPQPWAPVRGGTTNNLQRRNNDHGLDDLDFFEPEILPQTPQAARRPPKPQAWAPARNVSQRPIRRNKDHTGKIINFNDDGQDSKKTKKISTMSKSNESRIRSASLSSSPYVKVTRVM